MEKKIINHAIDGLDCITPGNTYGCDLHNELFNRNYFIIGNYYAEKFLIECDEGVFKAIDVIKNYEQDMFGEVYTDFSSSEKVANMYAYIKGEELLSGIKTLSEKWDAYLEEEDLKAIKKELEELL
jgi:hypothetical protein